MSMFTISRVFDAPRDLVFSMWTEPQHFEYWFRPKGCVSKLVYADVRVGGYYEKEEQFPGGTVFRVRCAFREISPVDLLSFVVYFVDKEGNDVAHPSMPLWPSRLMTRVYFEDEGAGTKITATWDTIDATEEETAFFLEHLHFGREGWTQTLELLEERLEEVRAQPAAL